MKNEFDLDPGIDYLNTGTLSFAPRQVLQSHIDELVAYEKNPTASLFAGWGRLWQVQKKVAQFFGADAKDFFLRHNVTGAMNDFLLGVRLPPGDIAVTNLEYGAITNICQYRCLREGRKLITVEIPDEKTIPSDDFLVDHIVSSLPESVRLLMLSHVMTGTGLKIPLKKLAHKLKDRGVIIAVDGAHGAGAFKINLSKLEGVHFYGGNLHKWLLGPKGTGFGWIPPWFQDQVDVIQAGWTTFEVPAPFLPFGDKNAFATRMLMSSCLSFPTFYALESLMDWWNAMDEEKIFSRIEFLRGELEAQAKSRGWQILSPSAPKLKSQLLSLKIKPEYASQPLTTMEKLLRECGVQVALSPWRGTFVLRLSAHVYSDESKFPSVFERLDFLKA